MPHGPIEILGARERRRRWSTEQKLRIVAETKEPGATVVAVAARHDIYPGLLHAWRRLVQRGELVAEPMVRLLPVRITETMSPAADPPAPPTVDGASGTIEISLPDGSQVRVGDDVSLRALRRVLAALRG
jgi:transposase